MSISAVSASSMPAVQHASAKVAAQAPATTARAPDGDTPAMEARESAATKMAEKQNGGVAPSSNAQSTGINKVV